MRRKIISIITINLLLLFLISSCGQSGGSAPEPVMKDGYYLDTVCTVTVYRMADDQGGIKDAADMTEEAEAAIDGA